MADDVSPVDLDFIDRMADAIPPAAHVTRAMVAELRAHRRAAARLARLDTDLRHVLAVDDYNLGAIAHGAPPKRLARPVRRRLRAATTPTEETP